MIEIYRAFSKYLIIVTILMMGTGYALFDYMQRATASEDAAYSAKDYIAEKRDAMSSLMNMEQDAVASDRLSEPQPEVAEVWESPEGSTEGPFASFMKSIGTTFETAPDPVLDETAQADDGKAVKWVCQMEKTAKRCKLEGVD